jgi:hypothetical protein
VVLTTHCTHISLQANPSLAEKLYHSFKQKKETLNKVRRGGSTQRAATQ